MNKPRGTPPMLLLEIVIVFFTIAPAIILAASASLLVFIAAKFSTTWAYIAGATAFCVNEFCYLYARKTGDIPDPINRREFVRWMSVESMHPAGPFIRFVFQVMIAYIWYQRYSELWL